MNQYVVEVVAAHSGRSTIIECHDFHVSGTTLSCFVFDLETKKRIRLIGFLLENVFQYTIKGDL